MAGNAMTIRVGGMGCQKCVASVEGALRRLEPRAEVAVDLAAGTVTLRMPQGAAPPDRAAAEAAIEDAGYDILRAG